MGAEDTGGSLVRLDMSAQVLMKAIANVTHWKVLSCLVRGPSTVQEVTARVPVEMSTVSNSLALWRAYGVVRMRVVKNSHVNELAREYVTIDPDGTFRVTFATNEGSLLAIRHEYAPDSASAEPGRDRHGRESASGSSGAAPEPEATGRTRREDERGPPATDPAPPRARQRSSRRS